MLPLEVQRGLRGFHRYVPGIQGDATPEAQVDRPGTYFITNRLRQPFNEPLLNGMKVNQASSQQNRNRQEQRRKQQRNGSDFQSSRAHEFK
jgi:hypothetical protein